MVKNLPAMQETQLQSLGWEDLLEKRMETHSSILAWRSPWTGVWWATAHGVAESDTTDVTNTVQPTRPDSHHGRDTPAGPHLPTAWFLPTAVPLQGSGMLRE